MIVARTERAEAVPDNCGVRADGTRFVRVNQKLCEALHWCDNAQRRLRAAFPRGLIITDDQAENFKTAQKLLEHCSIADGNDPSERSACIDVWWLASDLCRYPHDDDAYNDHGHLWNASGLLAQAVEVFVVEALGEKAR